MNSVSIDLHRKRSHVAVLADDGTEVLSRRIINDPARFGGVRRVARGCRVLRSGGRVSVCDSDGRSLRPFRTRTVLVGERIRLRKDIEMAVEPIAPADRSQTPDTLRIDFLFLDLTTCTRCLGANRSLESALEVVREVLEAIGVGVEVTKVLVQSEDQARALRFVSSPTIRVNGEDVALELRESSCGSEACTDGCGEQIACRVWMHRGKEYTEPPLAMIVDAILGRLYGGALSPGASEQQRYELPENLARFFAARAGSAEPTDSACCSSSEQDSCCEAEAKSDCCGAGIGEGCGCR
jgi:hypothetical protein